MHQWDSEDDLAVKKAYFKLLGRGYKNRLHKFWMDAIKKVGHDFYPVEDYSRIIPFRPPQIASEDWQRLCNHWNTAEWKCKSKLGKKNKVGKDAPPGAVDPKHSFRPQTKEILYDKMVYQFYYIQFPNYNLNIIVIFHLTTFFIIGC